jgi:hypothetical protein
MSVVAITAVSIVARRLTSGYSARKIGISSLRYETDKKDHRDDLRVLPRHNRGQAWQMAGGSQ